jgi:hypothetical protein
MLLFGWFDVSVCCRCVNTVVVFDGCYNILMVEQNLLDVMSPFLFLFDDGDDGDDDDDDDDDEVVTMMCCIMSRKDLPTVCVEYPTHQSSYTHGHFKMTRLRSMTVLMTAEETSFCPSRVYFVSFICRTYDDVDLTPLKKSLSSRTRVLQRPDDVVVSQKRPSPALLL